MTQTVKYVVNELEAQEKNRKELRSVKLRPRLLAESDSGATYHQTQTVYLVHVYWSQHVKKIIKSVWDTKQLHKATGAKLMV